MKGHGGRDPPEKSKDAPTVQAVATHLSSEKTPGLPEARRAGIWGGG